jgi:hypothetical protein
MRRARVRIGGNPADVEIEVDGQRIEGGVRSLTIQSSAGCYPQISLDVATIEEVDVQGLVSVYMTSTTRDALVALGWTPPPEQIDVSTLGQRPGTTFIDGPAQ